MSLFCFLIANLMKFEKKSEQASPDIIAILKQSNPILIRGAHSTPPTMFSPIFPLKTTLLSFYWASELVVKCFLFVCLNTREDYP